MNKRYYCKCGSLFAVSGPPWKVEELMAVFLYNHSGPNCGKTTARLCAAARRRADNQDVMETIGRDGKPAGLGNPR